MSLLGNIKNVAMSVVEGLEDVEALKTMRASGFNNASAAEPRQSHATVASLTCPKCGGAIHVAEGQKQCFCTPLLQSHLLAYLNKVVSGFIRYSLVIFMSRKAEMISSPELCVSRQAAC